MRSTGCRWTSGLTLAATAMALLARSPSCVLVVSIQNLVLSMKVSRSWTFSFNEGSEAALAVYGSAVLLPVSVLLKEDILGVVVEMGR